MSIPRSSLSGCPCCHHRGYTYNVKRPEARTCTRCSRIYIFSERDDVFCEKCLRRQAICVCYPPGPKPEPGQWIKIIRKFNGGLIETWEGPVFDVIWDEDPRILRSVRIGTASYRRTFNLGVQETNMPGFGAWEIIAPPEPPNKSVWVCPAVKEGGKLGIWRRLDHLAGSGKGQWFYPGVLAGATWAEVCANGPGYLLEPKND